MGINVLKTYFTWPWPPPPDIRTWKTVIQKPPQDHKTFLDACQENGVYALLGVALDAGNIFDNADPTLAADFKGFYLAVVDKLTQQYADHPAVMGFVLGNEMNNPDRCQRQDFWSINSEFAQVAKKNAPDKLILQAFQNDPALFTYKAPYKKDGTVQTLTVPEIYWLNYNVWGLNVFNGKTFFPFWSRFKSQIVNTPYNLPLIMTECGVPAGTNDPVDKTGSQGAKAVELPDNAAAVATYLESLWNDLIANKDIVSGATFFEYTDEWWKGNGSGPCVHDVGSDGAGSAFPGKWWEPAWWGFYSIAPNGRTCADGPWDNAHNRPYPPDILTARAAVATMKGLKLPTAVKLSAEAPMAATSIKITYKTEGDQGYLKDVSGLVVGTMVDPVTGDYWAGPFNTNPWTWNNTGSNVRAFGLMGNYNYAGPNPGLKIALSKLVVDPTKMTTGDHEVVAYLCTCKIGPGNIILRFKRATLDGKDAPGIVYVNKWGTHKPQPDCNFYDCPEPQK